MITKKGLWSYSKQYDDLLRRIERPCDRYVYMELQHRVMRKEQRAPIRWQAQTLVLDKGFILLKLRELARELEIPYTTLHRRIQRLQQLQLVLIWGVSRQEREGMILYVPDADELPDLNAKATRYVDQYLTKITSESNWENSPQRKSQWISLNQRLDQLRKALSRYNSITKGKVLQIAESETGSLKLQRPKTVFNTSIEGNDDRGAGKVLEASHGAQGAPKNEGRKEPNQSNGAPVGAPSVVDSTPEKPAGWEVAGQREPSADDGWTPMPSFVKKAFCKILED